MSKHTPIEKCEGLSADEIDAQIKIRLGMLPQFVGWLYPDILRSEIARLREMASEEAYRARNLGEGI
jgi:hypothetical protein